MAAGVKRKESQVSVTKASIEKGKHAANEKIDPDIDKHTADD